MESDAKYILIGSFMLIMTVAFAVSVLWLTQVSDTRKSRFYTIYFQSQSLDGLQKDSDVTMKGIKVGSVADYQVSERNIEQVKATLRIDQGTPIKENTKAAIKRNLLTGLAKVDLVGSTQESSPLTTILSGEKYPVIPEGQTGLERLADTVPKLLDRVRETGDHLDNILSEENAESLKKTLDNIRQVTDTFAQNRKLMEDVMKKMQDAADGIAAASTSFRSFSKNLGDQSKEVGGELTRALEEITKAAQKLDGRTGDMAKAVRDAAAVFSHEVTTMSQSISTAASGFSKAAEGFENPKSIITGPSKGALGPGESLRK